MKKPAIEVSPYEALAAQVQLRDLSLIESSSRVEPNHISPDGQLVMDAPHYFGVFVDGDGDGQTLVCGIKLALRLVAKEPFLLVTAEYQVTYSVPKGVTHAPEAAMAFASRNAVFNVWPFFRELAWSLASRSGFPPVLAPLFRLPNAPHP